MPSPALQKMLRMSPGDLQEYIKTLEQERASVIARLKRAEEIRPVEPRDPRRLLEARLGKLIEKARQLADNKMRGGGGGGGSGLPPRGPRRF